MIHYIAGYADADNIFNKRCSLAGVAKMNYIVRCLSEVADYRIYSTAQSVKPMAANKNERVKYRFSFPTHNKYTFYLDRTIGVIQLLWYLLRVPENDTVIVYHERWYSPWVQAMHKVKKWKLVYEVEEIYCAVADRREAEIAGEIKQLQKADAYILSTLSLSEALSLRPQDRYAVCNGVYAPVYWNKKQNSSRIHIVYGGSLNQAKGAWLAIEAMSILPKNYILHICGTGSDKDVKTIHELIAQYNKNDNIVFDGCLSEEDHMTLLQNADIGLCPANPTAAFPSKILEYMRNGMKVVSVRKPEIEDAECADQLYFFEENDVNSYVDAIVAAEKGYSQETTALLERMHYNFVNKMKQMLQ